MSKRRNLLIISAISPLPNDSGGATRIYNELRELSKYFNIYFIFFVENISLFSKRYKDEIKKYTKRYWLIEKKEKSELDFFKNFVPYWFSDWNVKEIDHILANVINQYNVDFVQVEFPPLLHLVRLINLYKKDIKKIYVALDIAFISFWRRLVSAKIDLFKKVIHFLRFLEVLFYEMRYLRDYDFIVTMSETDKKYINKFINKPILIVPNGIVKIKFLGKKVNYTIGYIGSFSHPPNRDAVIYLVKEIFFELYKKNKRFKLYIYGNNPNEEIKQILENVPNSIRKAIRFWGFVESLEDIYKSIDILVAPLFAGSGTRLKIIESLAFGTPVITTNVGAEGLLNYNLPLLFVEDSKKAIIKRILYFYRSRRGNKFKIINKKAIKELEKKLNNLKWAKIFYKYYEQIKKIH